MQTADKRSCLRSFGEETIVYHEGSGDLHLLNDVATAVLLMLRDHSPAVATLAADVAESLGYKSDSEFEQQVARLLRDFDRLGLVQTTEHTQSAE